MTATFQFVDSIAASPTVRLDLNDGATWTVDKDSNLSPPPLRRSLASTLMRDGEPPSAAAFGNRTLSLVLDLQTATQDASWTATQNLWRELNRPTNILKVQLGTVPVFFRTYRAPDVTLEMLAGRVEYQRIAVEIPAEPFGLGLREDIPFFTLGTHPASSDPTFKDLSSIKGDVETPLFARMSPGLGASADAFGTAVMARRALLGSPAFTPQEQAETYDSAIDTTTVADATMSGGNVARTSFATDATYVRRIFKTISDASLGTYRVFARVRRSAAATTVTAGLAVADGSGANQLVLPARTTISGSQLTQIVDLGLVELGPSTPASPGYSSTPSEVTATLGIHASRDAGAGTIDWDWVGVIPADEQMFLLKWAVPLPAHSLVLDGPNRTVYGHTGDPLAGTGGSLSYCGISWMGDMPSLIPGVTNRFYLAAVILANGVAEDLANDQLLFTCSYWPRYLLVPGS